MWSYSRISIMKFVARFYCITMHGSELFLWGFRSIDGTVDKVEQSGDLSRESQRPKPVEVNCND